MSAQPSIATLQRAESLRDAAAASSLRVRTREAKEVRDLASDMPSGHAPPQSAAQWAKRREMAKSVEQAKREYASMQRGGKNAAAAAAADATKRPPPAAAEGSDHLSHAQSSVDEAAHLVRLVASRLDDGDKTGDAPDVSAGAAVAPPPAAGHLKTPVSRKDGCYSSMVLRSASAGAIAGAPYSAGGTCVTPRAYEPFGEEGEGGSSPAAADATANSSKPRHPAMPTPARARVLRQASTSELRALLSVEAPGPSRLYIEGLLSERRLRGSPVGIQ